MVDKQAYESPTIEVLEFVLEDGIASSNGVGLYEDIWGGV